MPRATSDFRNPVCLEMKPIRSHYGNPYSGVSYTAVSAYSPLALDNGNGNGDGESRNNNHAAFNNNNNNNNEMGSVDSSETFASCNTHPSHSQADLSADAADANLYVNPMDKSTDNSPVQSSVLCFGRAARGVKKSASGDTALRSLGASPMDETFRGFAGFSGLASFGGLERGSRGSLNDSPLPKHRKTRFQQSARPRTRFGDSTTEKPRFESQESLESSKKSSRRASFMPSRSLASATRIINQHLFGLHTLGGSRTGKNGSSKSSLSVDSIDASPQLEQHRRSKSILKKSDSSGHRNGREDPESERLISDNMSGSGVEFSPTKRAVSSTTPPARHRSLAARASVKSLPVKQPPSASTEASERSRALKSPLFLLDDILSGDKQQRDRSHGDKYHDIGDTTVLGVSEVPLYICPPPPPMDEHSPTEETRLLLHQTPLPVHKQTTGNSTAKSSGLTS